MTPDLIAAAVEYAKGCIRAPGARYPERTDPRMIPIDKAIAAEWARLVGVKDKNRIDRALVATARVCGLVLVRRNVTDVRGCGVQVLDPFRRRPKIEVV